MLMLLVMMVVMLVVVVVVCGPLVSRRSKMPGIVSYLCWNLEFSGVISCPDWR